MLNKEARAVTVNQAGYPADAVKTAIFAGRGGTFRVIDEASDAVVYEGITTGEGVNDEASGLTVYKGDFTSITASGRYRVELDGGIRSAVFAIGDKPYRELHRGLLKAFYYFRCGMELTEQFAGPWAHRSCHTAEGIVYGQPGRRLDGCGGWHDAGDYGKYSGPGAKAVADLLLAYELYPAAFAEPVPLPETDGIMPDVLHECRYELDFLLKMQDAETGGVFHKLTTLQFPPIDTMPEDDTAELIFAPVSAAATGCFAAVMAMAARIYRPFDAGFAQRCLEAAVCGWDWLQRHPEAPGFRNPAEIGTGEYGDSQDIDERYWAAAELYRTTGKPTYHEAFRKYAEAPFFKYNLGWADMGGYGTTAYLLGGEAQADAAVYRRLLQGLIDEAQRLAKRCKEDGYLISLSSDDYIWGSNMVVMNNAMLLLIAYYFTGDETFEACALDHIHYIMGRNALDISYVTGFGDRPVMFPHHRPSAGDKVADPVPGMLSGGPNSGLNDDCARAHLQGRPPAQCFIDHTDSYATNEVTIYWNSPALFVVSHWAR